MYSVGGELFWKVATWETGRQDEIWTDAIVESHAVAWQNNQSLD